MSFNELSEKYASRVGLPSMNSVGFEDFIQVLELVAMKNRGFSSSRWTVKESVISIRLF